MPQNVKAARVNLTLRPIKVAQIGGKLLGRLLGQAWVKLEMPDGKTIKLWAGDTVEIDASFDYGENGIGVGESQARAALEEARRGEAALAERVRELEAKP